MTFDDEKTDVTSPRNRGAGRVAGGTEKDGRHQSSWGSQVVGSHPSDRSVQFFVWEYEGKDAYIIVLYVSIYIYIYICVCVIVKPQKTL